MRLLKPMFLNIEACNKSIDGYIDSTAKIPDCRVVDEAAAELFQDSLEVPSYQSL